MPSLGEETGLCEKAGGQLREYCSRSGTDDVLLLTPKCEELVLQLVSFFSFALRKEVVHAVVLMLLFHCGVYFLLADRKILLSEMYGDSSSKSGSEVRRIWLASFSLIMHPSMVLLLI